VSGAARPDQRQPQLRDDRRARVPLPHAVQHPGVRPPARHPGPGPHPRPGAVLPLPGPGHRRGRLHAVARGPRGPTAIAAGACEHRGMASVRPGPGSGAYAHAFARVAACTFPISIADPAANAQRLLEQARRCHEQSVAVAVFTELCLTGYAIDDLFLQDTVLDGVAEQLDRIVEHSRDLLPVLVVGAPLRHGTRLYNTAVVIHRGRVLGVAPKSALPNYREFYERRWFAPGDDARGQRIELGGASVPFGPDLLFAATDVPGL